MTNNKIVIEGNDLDSIASAFLLHKIYEYPIEFFNKKLKGNILIFADIALDKLLRVEISAERVIIYDHHIYTEEQAKTLASKLNVTFYIDPRFPSTASLINYIHRLKEDTTIIDISDRPEKFRGLIDKYTILRIISC